ncbi:MAG: N-acetylmuramoyl-L-alanine amidase, partial [Opitutaceae bacterium]|nr:N-acetylmuramoyl-L-alanine amidase [Opitutaceae bacterium]
MRRLVLLLALAAACPAATPPPKGAVKTVPVGVRFNGVDYIEAGAAVERFGLKPGWLAVNKTLRLAGNGRRFDLVVDKREGKLDGLSVFLGEPVLLRNGAVYVSRGEVGKRVAPLLSPRPGVRPRLIVIDPGHGGSDPGALNAALKIQEKAQTLALARVVAKKLSALGYRVRLTRSADDTVALERRAELASRVRADLFVSLHFNATASAGVSGVETYSMTPRNQRSTRYDKPQKGDAFAHPGNLNDDWNILLAHRIQRRLVDNLGAADRGLKRARFVVLQ